MCAKVILVQKEFYLFRFQISCFKSILAFGAHFLVIYGAYESLWRIINGLMFFMVQLPTCFILKIHNQKGLCKSSDSSAVLFLSQQSTSNSTAVSVEAFESLSWDADTSITRLTLRENDGVVRSLDPDTSQLAKRVETMKRTKQICQSCSWRFPIMLVFLLPPPSSPLITWIRCIESIRSWMQQSLTVLFEIKRGGGAWRPRSSEVRQVFRLNSSSESNGVFTARMDAKL